jgi:tryptophan halogenase
MSIPPELKANIDLFRDSGRFYRNADEMFADISWIEVMLGQGIEPRAWHPLVEQVPTEDVYRFVAGVEQTIDRCVDAMPTHQAFIDRYCAATPHA